MEIPKWEPMHPPQIWQRAKDGQACRHWVLPPGEAQAGPEGLTRRGMDISWVLSVCQLRAITGCGPLKGMVLYRSQVSNELADIREPEKSGYPCLRGPLR